MDSNPDERPSKIRRRVDDRISELPDLILTKILSFLPTKYAFAATILSTRWKNLFPVWIPPVKLDLDDSVVLRPSGYRRRRMQEYYFENFVDKLFNETLRGVHCLETVTLKCKMDYDYHEFMSWVRAAVSLNVRELCLKCDLEDSLPLFNILNQCTKLTLELEKEFSFWNMGSSIKPNKLKTLNLCNIQFGEDELSMGEEGTMITGLNRCCPELEELSLIDCNLQSLGPVIVLFEFPRLKTLKIRNSLGSPCKVTIETPKLKTLDLCNVTFSFLVYDEVEHDDYNVLYSDVRLRSLIADFPELEDLSLTNCEWEGVSDLVIESRLLRSLSIRNSLSSSNRLMFNTPNLQLLLLSDRTTRYNFNCPFGSLWSTHIDVGPSEKQLTAIYRHGDKKEPWYYKHVRGLVRYCSDTRHLHLSTRSVEVLCHTPVGLPTFHNLASLKLGCLCRSGWKVLARVLCSSPYLEKLVFEKGFEECDDGYAEFESVVSTPPVCLKLNLKEIEFLEFNDLKDGFKLIE